MLPRRCLSSALLLLFPVAFPACNGDDLAGPTTGTLQITTTTSGPEPDPNGYTVHLGAAGDHELFVTNADGTGVSNISNSPAVYDQNPDW